MKLCKIGRKGSFYSSFFIHIHVKALYIYTRKMNDIYFSRKRCLKRGKMECKKTNKNEDTLVKTYLK